MAGPSPAMTFGLVMSALVAGIHVFAAKEGVDARDKPAHDDYLYGTSAGPSPAMTLRGWNAFRDSVLVLRSKRERRPSMHRLLVCAAALALAAGTAAAHHGWGSYDASKVVVLDGPILESAYEFPHGEVVMEGEGKKWQVVLAPPSRMERRGLEKAALKPGATVTVEGYANREKPGELRAERIVVDGKNVELR